MIVNSLPIQKLSWYTSLPKI